MFVLPWSALQFCIRYTQKIEKQNKKKIQPPTLHTDDIRHPMMQSTFPKLCECTKHDGFIEHHSLNYMYVLWVLPDGRHIAFLHKEVLANGLTNRGNTFGELVLLKQSLDEPCKMVSRPFLQMLGFKPDYVVVTDFIDEAPTSITCGYTMHTILFHAAKNPTMEHIRTLAEGPGEPCGRRWGRGRGWQRCDDGDLARLAHPCVADAQTRYCSEGRNVASSRAQGIPCARRAARRAAAQHY